MLRLILAIGVLALLFPASALAHEEQEQQRSAAVAYAAPLSGIVIDGKLDDWPTDAVRYPLLNLWNPYGPTDLDGKQLVDNLDLTAWFMVGYSAVEDYIYIAVTVRDDSHVPRNPDPNANAAEADATEVFIDGLHAERHTAWEEFEGIARLAALQYVGIAGEGGAYVGEHRNLSTDNPFVKAGRLADTNAKFAARRDRDLTTYEWAVQAYSRFPKLMELEPGQRLGFDLVAVDLDFHDVKVTDHAAWVPFGYPWLAKFDNASSMADLVLLNSSGELGKVVGLLTESTAANARAYLVIEVWKGPLSMGEVHCDADGRFELALPAGDYVLRPRRGQNVVSFTIEAKVIGGRTRPATIAIQPLNDVTVLGAEALAALHAFEHALEDRDKDKVWALLQAHPTLAQGRSAHGSLLAPAASHGWLDVCALMLDHSAAEVDKAPGAATALHQAAWHGHLEVVKLLIARGLPVDPVENEYGGTPLGWAIHGAHHSGSNGDYVGIAQALLEAGAKPTGLDMTQGPDDPFYKLLVAHGAK